MFNRFQFHFISESPLTGKKGFSLQIGVHHQNRGGIIVHITHNYRHGFFSGKLRSVMASVSCNQLITAFQTGTGNRRCHNTKLCDALHSFLHGIIVQHLEWVSFKWVKFRKRNLLYPFLLGFFP